MKQTHRFLSGLVACGIALAMVSSLAAQTMVQGTAKVVRIKGHARYTTGNGVFQPLAVGAILKPGTLVQTEKVKGSFVDLVLGEAGGAAVQPASMAMGESLSYQPSAEQNVVRVWEDSALAIDKLTSMDTGAGLVTDTQLDLQRGRIFGSVKKMSTGSKYEIKIPNGVAGIKGTVYELTAEGVLKVAVGSVVLAYIGPDGNPVTQVVLTGQQFDARTGQITPIPSAELQLMTRTALQARAGLSTAPLLYVVDQNAHYVSPIQSHGHHHQGGGGGGG